MSDYNLLAEVFDQVMASPLGGEINLDACQKTEHYVVLQFWNGVRYMLTCPFLEVGDAYDPKTGKRIPKDPITIVTDE